MPQSIDFEFIEGTGWDGQSLCGRLDYGDDFDWDGGHLTFCECGNVKQDKAERCQECFIDEKRCRGDDNPYAIRERPKKEWDPIEYIHMIRAEIMGGGEQ